MLWPSLKCDNMAREREIMRSICIRLSTAAIIAAAMMSISSAHPTGGYAIARAVPSTVDHAWCWIRRWCAPSRCHRRLWCT